MTTAALLAALTLIAGPLQTSEPADAVLTLTLEVEAATGTVGVALFDSAGAYDGDGAPVAAISVDIASGERVARFPGLKPGTYAARMFHDVNGDGQMNTNPFGMPTEPFGFTNNAVGNMGPARWDSAVVTVEGAVEQTIRLK